MTRIVIFLVLSLLYTSGNQAFGQEESRENLSKMRGYYLGRINADIGIMSAVVPNCINANQQKHFFSSYGRFLLDEGAAIIGTLRVIEFDVAEKHLGKKNAQIFEAIGQKNLAAIYQAIKQEFKNTPASNMPRVCLNFRKQLENREINFEGHVLNYLEVLKRYDIEEYNKGIDVIRMMLEVVEKLKKMKQA